MKVLLKLSKSHVLTPFLSQDFNFCCFTKKFNVLNVNIKQMFWIAVEEELPDSDDDIMTDTGISLKCLLKVTYINKSLESWLFLHIVSP